MQALAGTGLKNVQYRAIESADELETVLAKARQGGRRVLACVEKYHVVGLKPKEEDLWTLHGTGGPYPTNRNQAIGAHEIFPLLVEKWRYHKRTKSYKQPNLLIFPSERKRR